MRAALPWCHIEGADLDLATAKCRGSSNTALRLKSHHGGLAAARFPGAVPPAPDGLPPNARFDQNGAPAPPSCSRTLLEFRQQPALLQSAVSLRPTQRTIQHQRFRFAQRARALPRSCPDPVVPERQRTCNRRSADTLGRRVEPLPEKPHVLGGGAQLLHHHGLVALVLRVRRKRRSIHIQLHFPVDVDLAELGPLGSFPGFLALCLCGDGALPGWPPGFPPPPWRHPKRSRRQAISCWAFFSSPRRSSTKFSNRPTMARASWSAIAVRSIF